MYTQSHCYKNTKTNFIDCHYKIVHVINYSCITASTYILHTHTKFGLLISLRLINLLYYNAEQIR